MSKTALVLFILKRLFLGLKNTLLPNSCGLADQEKFSYLKQLKKSPTSPFLIGSYTITLPPVKNMATAQVIFLNRWLDCPFEVRRQHQLIQTLISEEKAKFEYETRDYTPFQKALSRQRSYNLFRDRIRLVVRDGKRIDVEGNEEEI